MTAAEHGFGKRVGGVLCLDFVNTVRGRASLSGARSGRDYVDTIVGERITSCDALLRWGVFAGVLTARRAKLLAGEADQRLSRATTVLRRALALREATYRLFKSAIEGWPPRPDDIVVVDRELQIARAHERLTASSSGFALQWDDTPAIDRVLWPVVRSTAELLTSPHLERVGQCPGDECGWLFLDTSRSRRRQWCDMKDCGNVAKVRRFRQRHRDEEPERA